MVVFLDCEFTDFIDIELISIALVTEDGRELYIERSDFGVERCSAFTREAILPRLAQPGVPILDRDRLRHVVEQWFAELSVTVTLACDHQVDYELLVDALDGTLPANLTSRLDLSRLEAPFHRTVSAYHAVPGQAWHHALHDARAFLVAWHTLSSEDRRHLSSLPPNAVHEVPVSRQSTDWFWRGTLDNS